MKKYIVTILVIMLIGSLSLTLLACSPESEKYTPQDGLAHWMDYIDDDTPLRRVAIPGTHDSGTIGMMSLAETQRSTIGDQLTMGTRYFDIRVTDDGKIFHGPIKGTDFDTIASDIATFIKAQPSETLILDFQHFKGDSAPKYVYDTLKAKGVLDIAIDNKSGKSDLDFIDSLTMADVRGKVLIFFGSDFEADYTNIFRRNNDGCTIEGASLDSLYIGDLHKKGSLNFLDEAVPKYMEHIIAKNSGILVLQGQLTAPNLFVSPLSLEMEHRDNMLQYINDNIATNSTYLAHVNVIMRDFIEQDVKKSTSIIALNYHKGYVKADSVDTIKKLCDIA